jgi:very-short-patch-repair endonuclease
MKQIRSRARALRNNPTEVEKLLWCQLRMWQLDGYKFRRQQPLGNYIVDFVCLEKRLIVELDGGQHAEQSDYDASAMHG